MRVFLNEFANTTHPKLTKKCISRRFEKNPDFCFATPLLLPLITSNGRCVRKMKEGQKRGRKKKGDYRNCSHARKAHVPTSVCRIKKSGRDKKNQVVFLGPIFHPFCHGNSRYVIPHTPFFPPPRL